MTQVSYLDQNESEENFFLKADLCFYEFTSMPGVEKLCAHSTISRYINLKGENEQRA